MRLISSLACAVVGLALQACALPAHNNTLVFAVNRDIGVGVASGPTDAGVNIHLGYKSRELAWVPLWANQGGDAMPCMNTTLSKSGGSIGSSTPTTVSATATGTGGISCMHGPKFVGDSEKATASGNDAHDAYSTFASFGGSLAGSAGGSASANATMASFFATGVAAQHLAKQPGVVVEAAKPIPNDLEKTSEKTQEKAPIGDDLSKLLKIAESTLKVSTVALAVTASGAAASPSFRTATPADMAATVTFCLNEVQKIARVTDDELGKFASITRPVDDWMTLLRAERKEPSGETLTALDAAAKALLKDINRKVKEDGTKEQVTIVRKACGLPAAT